ncbi:uncharacterized protein F4807DRAFT_469336 [Annulohypoxylon truncatum]|uniref:uncharacterized protein n=1 Tax=Annulohypoxylon truncatum TaxID=327061 RepID=UPI0020072F60|nr:uncharacterized protein F4807DRAFT_469336 [Annulohypoxylon truncatum]KAI1207548.1 hypothetical protein F4807DRAFT_469336 [Annulohypoxylon truncatum]
MSATSAKASAVGSKVEGHSKQILDNHTWTSIKKINNEYWKTVLILSILTLVLVAIVAGVLATQLSKSGKDSSSAPEQLSEPEITIIFFSINCIADVTVIEIIVIAAIVAI